jgi:hypothetical protein
MSKPSVYVLILALAFWTAVIGVADYFVFGTTARQFLARDFASTTGEIVESHVTQLALLRAGITIHYSYTVRGREYRGSGYRYDDQFSAVSAEDVVRRFPRYSKQTVYFNPKNPADSILSPGVDGNDLMVILFATPINVVSAVLWIWVLAHLGEKRLVPPAGGMRIRRQEGLVRVRLADVSALEAGFYALGIASFAATFPVVVVNGLVPGVEPMEVVWAAVLAGAGAAFCWKAIGNASGKYDLLIDQKGQTLTLPQTCGRQQSITLPWRKIAGVSLQRRVSRLASGSYYSYLPALCLMDANGVRRRELLFPWGWTEEKARSFSQWLGGELGREFKGVEEEGSGTAPDPAERRDCQ